MGQERGVESRRKFLKKMGCCLGVLAVTTACPLAITLVELTNKPSPYEEMLTDPRAKGFNKEKIITLLKEVYTNPTQWPNYITIYRNNDNIINNYYIKTPSPVDNKVNTIQEVYSNLNNNPASITGIFIEQPTKKFHPSPAHEVCDAIQRTGVNFDEKGEIFGNQFLDITEISGSKCTEVPPNFFEQMQTAMNQLRK